MPCGRGCPAIPPGWAATRRTFVEAGVWNPADMTPNTLVYLTASEVNRALASGTALPPTTVERLRTAPPDFWEVFFQYFPPERALEYGCTLIATPESAGDAETFRVLAEAVARHAATLPLDRQAELGRALTLEAERYWDRGASPVLATMLSIEGMPVPVNAGAAVELDRMLRIDQIAPPYPVPLQDAVRLTHGPGRGGATGAPFDPMVAALTALAADGEAALDFLAPRGHDDVGEARTRYWLGEQMLPDHGVAQASALRAAVSADANLSADDGTGRPVRAATTLSIATEALAGNVYLPEFSEHAATQVAAAYGPYQADLARWTAQSPAPGNYADTIVTGRADTAATATGVDKLGSPGSGRTWTPTP